MNIQNPEVHSFNSQPFKKFIFFIFCISFFSTSKSSLNTFFVQFNVFSSSDVTTDFLDEKSENYMKIPLETWFNDFSKVVNLNLILDY